MGWFSPPPSTTRSSGSSSEDDRMMTLAWVAAGGAVGSVARHLIAGGLNDRFHPWGTVVVNVAGSFLIGFFAGRWGLDPDDARSVGLTVGLLGGFTTFSAFSFDIVTLWEGGGVIQSTLVVLLSVGLGLAAAVGGLALGRS